MELTVGVFGCFGLPSTKCFDVRCRYGTVDKKFFVEQSPSCTLQNRRFERHGCVRDVEGEMTGDIGNGLYLADEEAILINGESARGRRVIQRHYT